MHVCVNAQAFTKTIKHLQPLRQYSAQSPVQECRLQRMQVVSPGCSSKLGTLDSPRLALEEGCLTIGGGQRLAVVWVEAVHCREHHVRQQRLLIQPGRQGQPAGTLHIARRLVFQWAQQALVGRIRSILMVTKQSE